MNREPGARRRALDDPHLPQYHFAPPGNWLNDPNGLLEWNGRYHLFYQHNPAEPRHENVHWGHASSPDLVRWTDHPIALAPEPGIDGDGCWSGCAVVDDGTPTLLYTGVDDGVQRQCLATGDHPDLVAWEKEGVVLADRPDAVGPDEFRDPHVWREGDRWEMLLGARIAGTGAAVLRYTSPDLREWAYAGPALVRGDRKGVLECPGLVRFHDADLLFYSVMDDREVRYVVGDVGDAEDRFEPRHEGVLDHGDLYAPQVVRDAGGRPLFWGWLEEARPEGAQVAAGWSGAMSVPRVLSLGPGGRLWQAPAPELSALRGDRERFEGDVAGSEALTIRGTALEVVAEFDPGDADAVGVAVRRSSDGEETTRVVVDPGAGRLEIDRSRSSLDDAVAATAHSGPVPIDDESVSLRVFVDGSVVEAFANGRACAASRIYPTRDDSDGVAVLSEGGAAAATVDAWPMGSIW